MICIYCGEILDPHNDTDICPFCGMEIQPGTIPSGESPADYWGDACPDEVPDFEYILTPAGIMLEEYTGDDSMVIIQESYGGVPVYAIDQDAFTDSHITSVVIPDSMFMLGSNAFWNCVDLTSIYIPPNVRFIDDNIFCYCESLREIIVDGANTRYMSDGGMLLTKDGQTLVAAPAAGMTGPCRIPDGVTAIGFYSFFDCEHMTSVSMPESVRLIDTSAFYECKGLTSVSLPSGLERIKDSAFAWCVNLGSIEIPGSVAEIGSEAFWGCRSLEKAVIADGVKTLGNRLFWHCDRLVSVAIPGSVTTIGEGIFIECGPSVVVTCPDGSCAQRYCEQNGIKYRTT